MCFSTYLACLFGFYSFFLAMTGFVFAGAALLSTLDLSEFLVCLLDSTLYLPSSLYFMMPCHAPLFPAHTMLFAFDTWTANVSVVLHT